MNWNHKAKKEWLEARRNYLTASEIVKLLPTTPTGRARAGLVEIMLKIWAGKQCRVSDNDVESFGAMARGHIMEPFAIEAVNLSGELSCTLFHWDDTLIHNADGVAYSPDSFDIEQPFDCPVSLASVDAKVIGEVKSYKGDAHYIAGLASSKYDLSERWQLAVGMYVSPTVKIGHLIFFNPIAAHPLFIRSYNRADLAIEMETIKKIAEVYFDQVKSFEAEAEAECTPNMKAVCPLEEDIIESLLLDQEAEAGGCLNPSV